MAYDEDLATRIRDLIGPDRDLTEKKMSGGLAFLIRGQMAVSASGQGGVLVHVDPGRSGDLVATTRATTAVMQGREMPGWLRVSPDDLAGGDCLPGWVESASGTYGRCRRSSSRRKAEEVSDAVRGLLRAADRRVSLLATSAEPVTASTSGRS